MAAAARIARVVCRALVTAVSVGALAHPAFAQDEAALKARLEGRRVTLRIDMPGTSDGVDIKVDSSRPLDFDDYRSSLKKYGTAIHAGDSTTVTLIKVKKDLIEFQLGGGGFGTFGDDTSTSVSMPLKEKTEREKTLERLVRDENDRDRRRALQRELDDLRDRRERENRRITIEKERAEALKAERVAERRLRGGSRFNLRYDDRVPPGMRPQDVMAALVEYVDFGESSPASVSPSSPIDITRLRKGMTRTDVERLLGVAAGSSSRREGDLAVTTLVFFVGDEKVTADLVEDVLVRYTIASK